MNITKNQLLVPVLFIVGSFIILSVSDWLKYILMATISIGFLIAWVHQNQELLRPMFKFLFEFMGFCLLVTLFVTTITLVYGLFF